MAEPRNCIKCNSVQEVIVIQGVEIDRCASCGGIWLDAGEIKQLVAVTGPGDDAKLEASIAQLSAARRSGVAAPAGAGDVATTPCPACQGKLTSASFGDARIEQCSACDGIFVDKGELAKAMRLVDTSEATTIMALAKSVTTSGSIG